MALLLPKRRQLLASPMAADIIMNLFVLEQMCLVSATNVLLSNSSAPAGCRRASKMQAGRPGAGKKTQLHIVCTSTQMYEYVLVLLVCALSLSSANPGHIMSDYFPPSILYILCHYYFIICHYYFTYFFQSFWPIMSYYVKFSKTAIISIITILLFQKKKIHINF
jgi:hypothetical protein